MLLEAVQYLRVLRLDRVDRVVAVAVCSCEVRPPTRRRKILLGILAVTLTASAAWLWYRLRPAQEPDFLLETTITEQHYPADSLAQFPLFDPASGGWLIGGRPVSSTALTLTNSHPEGVGPDSIGKYLVIRLPDKAGPGVYRQALAALAAEGICQVAVADAEAPVQSDFREAPVHRVIKVRDGNGDLRDCVDRFNPRPVSA